MEPDCILCFTLFTSQPLFQLLSPLIHLLNIYRTSKLLSPDLVDMSSCSTPWTVAADGPLLRCWTNSSMASEEP